MESNKISVIILAQNNSATIERTLKSAEGFDQIVVIDGGSTDNTLHIAKTYGAKIVHHPFVSFKDQRNFSLTAADHTWCLVVDSDEEITPKLREELYRQINSNPQALLFRIFRTEYLLGRENKYGYNRSFYQERFFNKEHISYLGELHEYPVIDGTKPSFNDPRTINLPKNCRLHHNPDNSLEMILARFPKYIMLKANEKIAEGRRVSLIEVLTCFPISFLRIFFRRARAGRIALFEAMIKSATRMFIKLLIYEHQLRNKSK